MLVFEVYLRMKKGDRLSAGIGAAASHAADAANALWNYVTALKRVRRQGGEEMEFDLLVLETSIIRAFDAAGKPDEFTARTVTEEVFTRLQSAFNGASVPSTEDVATAVDAVLTERGELAVKEAYHGKRVPAPAAPTPVRPPMPPVSTPVLETSEPKPMSTTNTGETYTARRRRLPEERKALTHKFQVGDQEGYLTVGLYDDGQPGEIFLKMSKEGTELSGFMDAFATAISIGLQYGVPLKVLANKFTDTRFAPNGPTKNMNIPEASSVMDYIFRYLALKFLTPEERQAIGMVPGGKQEGAFDASVSTPSLL